MKSYNEMASDVFCRRDEYEVIRKRRKKAITQTAAALCCVCLMALVGTGIRQSDAFRTVEPDILEDSVIIGEQDYFDDASKSESLKTTVVENKIVINQIDSVSAGKMNICLLLDDFVVMDKAELNGYYGINVFPTVPDDLNERDAQKYGIYKRDQGSGEIYWDGNVLNYSNADVSRSVNVEIEKDALPFSCCIFEISEKSIINSTEVGIALTDDGFYYAEFMYKNVGFRMIGEGLSEEEMITVITSLIQ